MSFVWLCQNRDPMEVPERWKKLFVAVGLLLPLLAIIWSLAKVPDAAVDGDPALLELGTRQTARGHNLLGPYSRYQFNHPGPAYFFLMLPSYYLSGQRHGSFLLTAVALNLVAVLLICLVVWRERWAVVLGSGLLLSLFLASLGTDKLYSAWNPDIPLLAFGAAIFSFAAAAAGRKAYLVPAIGLATLAVQSHVAFAASVGLVALTTTLALSLPWLVGVRQRDCWDWRVWVALLAFLTVLWLPPLCEELISERGNLTKIVSFFTLPHSHPSVSAGLKVLGDQVSDLLPALFPTRFFGIWPLAAIVFGCSGGYLFARRRGDALAASLNLLCLAGLVGAAISVSRIVGPIHEHLVAWTRVLGLVGLIALVAAFAPPPDRTNVEIRRASSLLFVLLFLLVSLSSLKVAWAPNRFEDWPNMPKHRQIAEVAELTKTRLEQAGIYAPEVRIAASPAWPAAAGVLLQLDKKQTSFCVEDAWLFLFGRGFACREPSDTLLIFGDAQFRKAVAEDPRFAPIAEWDEGAVFFGEKQATPSLIDFSGPESVLYLTSGFATQQSFQPGRGRWSVGSASTMTVPLQESRAHQLTISAHPLPVAGRVQRIRVSLNGSQLTEFPLVDREVSYSIHLPAGAVRATNELRFEYGYSEPPMLHQRDSTDWRPLGVFFRWARLVPVPAERSG